MTPQLCPRARVLMVHGEATGTVLQSSSWRLLDDVWADMTVVLFDDGYVRAHFTGNLKPGPAMDGWCLRARLILWLLS